MISRQIYITHLLKIAEDKYAHDVAVTTIVRELREKMKLAKSFGSQSSDRMRKMRDASSGIGTDFPLMAAETTLVADLMVELDAHRQVGTVALLLGAVLTALGEETEA